MDDLFRSLERSLNKSGGADTGTAKNKVSIYPDWAGDLSFMVAIFKGRLFIGIAG